MKYKNKILSSMILFCLIAVTGSCTHEDYSFCPLDDVRLYFRFGDAATRSGSLVQGDIELITVFVFDRHGRYVTHKTDDRPNPLDPEYYMNFSLETGEYSFVTWCNLYDYYNITSLTGGQGVVQKDAARIELVGDGSGIIDFSPALLFFGQNPREEIKNRGRQDINVPLVRNSYRLNFTTSGLPSTDAPYTFLITDTNGVYDFDNSFSASPEINYKSLSSGDSPSARMTVGRLEEQRKIPVLRLYDNAGPDPLITENLIELVVKLRDKGQVVDFTTMYDFDIHLEFKGVGGPNMIVNISVNGWMVWSSDSSLHP